MTLSFFLPLNCALPCWWEKGDPQLSMTAEEGQGRSSALSHASLGGKGNCRVLCLWFLWQIGASRDRKLKNLACLPPTPVCNAPCQRMLVGWAAGAAAPQIPSNLYLVPPGNRLVRQVGKTVLCIVLYSIHASLPLHSNPEDQTSLWNAFENISYTYILSKMPYTVMQDDLLFLTRPAPCYITISSWDFTTSAISL